MKTYPCVVGNSIVELTEEQAERVALRQMTPNEHIVELYRWIARLERSIEAAGIYVERP